MSNQDILTAKNSVQTEVERVFQLQKRNQQKVANSTARERSKKLKRLHQALLKYRDEIKEALYKDFKKHPSEVDLTEIYALTSEIKHARNNLSRWMAPKRVGTPLALFGSSSYIHSEPKGVVLIISPWNFPINLTFGPLISAIAAGNCAILKPSEHTPHASALMKKMVAELFDESEIALIEGDVEASTELLKLPFNHIFFTGSPGIGKIVMKAAAANLASVTLELGGKSPTIVDKTANLNDAAARISWGKFINNGQICIAPDYVFVHEDKLDQFLEKVKNNVAKYYGAGSVDSPSYARIVNQNHFVRLKGYLEDAVSKGANIEFGGKVDADQNFMEFTIVTNVSEEAELAKKEIFGPILPVYTFKDLQEVTDKINKKEKPLALYIYSKSSKNIKQIINNTRAGGTCINHNAIHFYNNDLPFGGVNNSGVGKGKGLLGFQEFSNQRGILKHWLFISPLKILTPPYSNFKQKLIDLTIKWL